MRMTMSTNSTMSPRIHRKGFRIPSKRQPGKGLPGKLHTIARVSIIRSSTNLLTLKISSWCTFDIFFVFCIVFCEIRRGRESWCLESEYHKDRILRPVTIQMTVVWALISTQSSEVDQPLLQPMPEAATAAAAAAAVEAAIVAPQTADIEQIWW